jgi:translation initiation factor 1
MRNPGLDDALDAIAVQGTRLHITVETRRYGKPVTVVEGFPVDVDVGRIAREAKRRLGTGGGAKDGRLELQGDQRLRLATLLRDMGFHVR